MIPGNQITLLQNGEGFFPAVEAALDRAVHDIYLETYILKNDAVGRRIAEALGRAGGAGRQDARPGRWIRLVGFAAIHTRTPSEVSGGRAKGDIT